MQPSQLAGPASRRPSPPPSSVIFVLDRGRGVWPARARATAPRHLSPCLPALPLLASMPWTTPRLPPALSHSPPALPSSSSLSLSHGRTPPSPPFATAAISGHPSLPRLAQKLRHNPLFLPTAPRVPGSPASPPRRRSPLRLRSSSPSNSSSPARPRARFDAHCNRGELRHRFPLFSPSFPQHSLLPTTAEPPPSPSSPSTQLR